MRKPSAAGVFACGSAIESFRAESLESKVPVDADEANQNPEDFHEESGEIEVDEQ